MKSLMQGIIMNHYELESCNCLSWESVLRGARVVFRWGGRADLLRSSSWLELLGKKKRAVQRQNSEDLGGTSEYSASFCSGFPFQEVAWSREKSALKDERRQHPRLTKSVVLSVSTRHTGTHTCKKWWMLKLIPDEVENPNQRITRKRKLSVITSAPSKNINFRWSQRQICQNV